MKWEVPPSSSGGSSFFPGVGEGPNVFRFNPRSADDIFADDIFADDADDIFFGFSSLFGGMGMGGGGPGGGGGMRGGRFSGPFGEDFFG